MHKRPALQPCPSCASLLPPDGGACPHCGAAHPPSGGAVAERALPAAALLMGLALAGCGDKDDASDAVALYGVADSSAYVDADGDGYTPDEGDCDDDNPDVNPGATETTGDAVDSNCDGDNDT